MLIGQSQFQNGYISSGRIEVITDDNIYHDSSSCFSTVDYSIGTITITNSTALDTLKLVGYQGNLLEQVINTTGMSYWSVPSYSLSGYYQGLAFIEDFMLDNTGYAFYEYSQFSNLYKIICGSDTLVVESSFPTYYGGAFQVSNPCSYGTVEGDIFIDNNNDCIFNTGDSAILGVTPSVTAGVSSGNNGGHYSLTVQDSWYTNYTVSMASRYQFIFPNSPCFTGSYNFTTLPQSGLDFALQCDSTDVQVALFINGAVRPIIPFTLAPRVHNIGCEAVSGNMYLVLDSRVTYNASNSTNPPNQINGDTLVWNYTNLTNATNQAYWNSILGNIELTPASTVNIGDTLCFKLFSDIPNTDVNIANNEYTYCYPVVNSYDPNIKEVMPKGVENAGYIAPETQKLTYTIHFQNTGNAPAINIHVTDTLTNLLKRGTLRILEASHTMQATWLDSNVIDFKFLNINLADSASNEPQSHGFVRFEIEMEQNLLPGTEIKNKAEIYFDNNTAVVTNYALNTIEELNTTTINELTELNITAYPNPMKDYTTFKLSNQLKKDLELSIYSISGKLLSQKRVLNTSSITLSKGEIPSGIYLYKVLDLNTQSSKIGKLIIY